MAEPVHLEHKEDFEKAIANLRVSERAKNVLKKAKMVALSGVAGGGRNTVIDYIVEHYPEFQFTVSDTTRPPKMRDGAMERDGVRYYFRTEEEVLHDIQSGEFIEAEIIHNQQVSGTSVREIERVASNGKIAIRDFEYKGVQNVASVKPDAFIIGLVPPNFDEWMRRLHNREVMSAEEFNNRMETAEHVLRNILDKPHFRIIVNDSIDECAADIRAVVNGTYSKEKEERARAVVHELLIQVDEVLVGKFELIGTPVVPPVTSTLA